MRKTVGGEDRLPNDDGGHLIARMFWWFKRHR